MLKRIQAARKTERGFTLIELLMVIVILGVLAGIVVFAVNGIQDRGQTAACQAELKTVQVAQEAYYAKSKYPPSYAASAQVLVEDGLLRDLPTYVTTNGDGDVNKVATAPSDC